MVPSKVFRKHHRGRSADSRRPSGIIMVDRGLHFLTRSRVKATAIGRSPGGKQPSPCVVPKLLSGTILREDIASSLGLKVAVAKS